MDRNLDGVYCRIERDGKWQNLSFSDLTFDERNDFLRDKSPEYLKSLCNILADTIKSIGNNFDIVGE